MTNGRHRARWLAEIVSEVQRYHSKTRESPEDSLVQKALNNLQDARQAALESDSDEKNMLENQ